MLSKRRPCYCEHVNSLCTSTGRPTGSATQKCHASVLSQVFLCKKSLCPPRPGVFLSSPRWWSAVCWSHPPDTYLCLVYSVSYSDCILIPQFSTCFCCCLFGGISFFFFAMALNLQTGICEFISALAKWLAYDTEAGWPQASLLHISNAGQQIIPPTEMCSYS